MKIRSKSLLLRLITPLSLLSIGTVLTISVSTYFSARETLKQSIYDRLSVAAILKEEELNHWFQGRRNDILLLAQLPEIQSQTEILLSDSQPDSQPQQFENQPEGSSRAELKQAAKKKLTAYLRDIVAFKPDLAEVSIVADGGTVLFSTNRQLINTEQSLDDQTTYFADASDKVTPVFYTSSVTGSTAITLATPILDDAKNRLGVLLVTLDLQDVDSLIQERTGLGKTGTTYLVGQLDQQNIFIASEQAKESAGDISSFAIDTAVTGESGAGLYQNYAGEPVIGVYRWLEPQSLRCWLKLISMRPLPRPVLWLEISYLLALWLRDCYYLAFIYCPVVLPTPLRKLQRRLFNYRVVSWISRCQLLAKMKSVFWLRRLTIWSSS